MLDDTESISKKERELEIKRISLWFIVSLLVSIQTFTYVGIVYCYYSECKPCDMEDLAQLHHSCHISLMKQFHSRTSQGNFLSLDMLSIFHFKRGLINIITVKYLQTHWEREFILKIQFMDHLRVGTSQNNVNNVP